LKITIKFACKSAKLLTKYGFIFAIFFQNVFYCGSAVENLLRNWQEKKFIPIFMPINFREKAL